MNRWLQNVRCLAPIAVVSVFILALTLLRPGIASAEVPKDQTYVGSKKCASCHFKQYMVWRKSDHATKAFKSLSAKYKKDASCLKCHTTGFGEATGFKNAKSTPNLAGTTCEACHGPGSKHAEIAEKFGKKKLSAEDEKEVRGSIHKIRPDNACVQCHQSKAHQPHPKYDK